MTGIAFLLLAAASAAPCESLAALKLTDATVTSAVVVPEGPPPARGAAPAAVQGGRGGARGGGAAQAQAAQPPATRASVAPANIPAHCRVQMVLTPTTDSLINM